MKTIKELEAELQSAYECDKVSTTRYKAITESNIEILKNVLGLIDEIEPLVCPCGQVWIRELKARIEGTSQKSDNRN